MFTRKNLFWGVAVGSIVAACFFIWLVRAALYPFLGALVIVYFLQPFILFFEKKGLSRLVALILVYLLSILICALFIILVIPLIVAEGRDFLRQLPIMILKGQAIVEEVSGQYQNLLLPFAVREEIDASIGQVQVDITEIIAGVAAFFIGFIRHSLDILISPVLAFYFLYDWNLMKQSIMSFFPEEKHPLLRSLAKEIQAVMTGVVRGQILVAVLVGVLVTLGLSILQVPFALLIGLIAAVLDVIPYFGAILGAVPAVTISLLHSPALALKVSFLFLLIHQLEGTVIGPKIFGDTLGLHPLVVIFLLLAGGELYGVVGMLFAVPVAALLKTFITHGIKAFR